MEDFLNRNEQVKLPVGGDFVTTGFIGKWFAAVMYSFMSEQECVSLEECNQLSQSRQEEVIAFEGFNPESSRKMGPDWIRYYFNEYDNAKKWTEELGLYDPQGLWVLQAATDTVLNMSDEGRQAFGDAIVYDHCRITTLRSKKYRHELHLIALPSAVAAYADAMGWDNPGFDLSELVSQDTVFGDDFYLDMCGDPDTGEYEPSVLWQRRVALWAALGEDNPKAYNPYGTGTKFDASDNKLSEALGILACPWSKEIWARVVPVADPRIDAIYGDEGKRLSIACIVTIFASEAAAKEAAEAEMAERGGTPADAQSGPSVPVDWQGYEDNWLDKVRELKELYPGPLPTFRKQLEAAEADGSLYKEHACTAAEAVAWYGEV